LSTAAMKALRRPVQSANQPRNNEPSTLPPPTTSWIRGDCA
jgi:hypothetical protein